MLVLSLLFFIKSMVMFVCLALGVGFYTLLERKTLSYIQLRKGPNKVGYLGLPQPLADAVKLFTKEGPKIYKSFKVGYLLGPSVASTIMFIIWGLYMSPFSVSVMKLGILFFIVVSSLNVYAVFLSGWASNSKYALLGGVRAVAQTISYEISMSLIFLSVLLLALSFNLDGIWLSQKFLGYVFVVPVLMMMWLVTSLAETNRAPFDLAEGESELVSGFNIEYGGGEFALLFIAEYGSILFISMITSCMFLKGFVVGAGLSGVLKILVIAFVFLWVRGSFPRMRYDILMSLTWKSFLLVSIFSVFVLMGHHN